MKHQCQNKNCGCMVDGRDNSVFCCGECTRAFYARESHNTDAFQKGDPPQEDGSCACEHSHIECLAFSQAPPRWQINIASGSFVHSLFMWIVGRLEDFGIDGYKDEFAEGTNICHLIRTIFLYFPLLIGFEAVILSMPVLALYTFPKWLFGMQGVFTTWMWIAITIGIVGLIILVVEGYDRLQTYLTNKKHPERPPKEDDGNPSLPTVVGAWVYAKKMKICPLITWSQE